MSKYDEAAAAYNNAMAEFLTEKTGFEWTGPDYAAVFDPETSHRVDGPRYEALDAALNNSTPNKPGLMEELEGYARSDVAIHWVARGGGTDFPRGYDPLCQKCCKLLEEEWGTSHKPVRINDFPEYAAIA